MSKKTKRFLSALLMLAVALQPAWAQNTGIFNEWSETDYSEFEISHEYFTPDGTAPSSSGGYDMTGYIPVKEGDVIVISGDRSPGIPFMVGYADDKGQGSMVLLGDFDANNWDGLQVTGEEVTIPAGTAFVRCSARNTSLPGWASRNLSVIKRSLGAPQRVIRILCIGNSFSSDTVESWLYSMAKKSGIQLVIGNAMRGGWGLRGHWTDIEEGNAETSYIKIVNGKSSRTYNHTLTEIINDEPWDIITFQQVSQESGIYSSYSPYLGYLIDYVKGIQPQAKLGWIMTWAYAQDANHAGFANYNNNQMTMYNAIVDANIQLRQDYPELEFLVPCGTAIQNLRSSFIGDRMNRDGVHINLILGRYATAYTLFTTLFGEDVATKNNYMPNLYINDYTLKVVKQAVWDAVRNPFAITPQDYPEYVGENTFVPADVQFNFSAQTETDIPGWNNLGPFYELSAGLKDAGGNDPGIFIWCDNGFSWASSIGPSVTDTPLNMPASVSKTALYGYSEGNIDDHPQREEVVMHFHHLNKSLVYDFTFFASCSEGTDKFETVFDINGANNHSATLDASGNTSNTVTLCNVKPDGNGTITLKVSAGSNNNNSFKLYYINALRISAHSSDFALQGDEQPDVGDSLSVSADSDLSQYTFRWTRGDVLGTFDDTALSSTMDYIITESDYEHWLRVTVCDNSGNTVFTKDTWISKLPVLYIDTVDGNPITSKKNYKAANLRIQGNADFVQQYEGVTEIRGRGQTSWMRYPQKPYKLKLEKKTNLFGFGKSKHWALISNFIDKSCLRNYIASKLARQLDVLGMDMTWVDVVLNGEVKGCYMLSQHVRVGKNNVNIFDWEEEAEDMASALFNAVKDEEALEEADKGLLEEAMTSNLAWVTDGMVTFKGKTYNLADYGLKKEYDIKEGYLFEAAEKTGDKTFFTTPQGTRFEISAPEFISTNKDMFDYVTSLWADFEAGYCQTPTIDGKPFRKYADIKSMVGVWLTNEIMGQDDPGNSRYSYIGENGKITFGPVWDFDHGGASWSVTLATTLFYTLYRKINYIYYRKWYPDPQLCQMTYDAYWDVARPFIMDYISEGGELDAKYAYFAEAGKTNDILWGDYPSTNPSAAPRTAAEDVEILRTFLRDHIKWLDQQFASVKTLIEAMNRVCVYPCDPGIIDGLSELASDTNTAKAQKVIKGRHLYIIKDGKTFSIDGKRMKNEECSAP